MIYKILLFILLMLSVIAHELTGDIEHMIIGTICVTGLCVINAIEDFMKEKNE